MPFHLEIIGENIRLQSWESTAIAMIKCTVFIDSHGSNLQTASWLPLPQRLTVPDPHREGTKLQQQWNFCRVQIRGQRRTQPSNLFVPVKCAQALMNRHHCIPLPHSHYCHYTCLEHFYTPSHTFHFPAVLIRRAIKTTTPPLNTPRPSNKEKPLAN